MHALVFREDLFLPSETFVWRRDNYPADAQVEFSCNRVLVRASTRDPTIVSKNSTSVARARFRLLGSASTHFHEKVGSASVVHSHFAVDAASLLPCLKRYSLPLVVSLHGFDVLASDQALARLGARGRLLVRRRQALIDRTSVFLCCSEYLRDAAIRKGFPSDRSVVHYTGFSETSLPAREQDSAQCPMLLFAGRLVENKGVRQVLEVARYLRSRRMLFQIKVVGSGPLKPLLENAIFEEGLPIDVVGSLSQESLHLLMARAALVLIPSRPIATGESEALNLVALEAGAIGVPVIANAVGGIPEVVFDGETGLLADHASIADFNRKVEAVLTDGVLHKQLSDNYARFSGFEKGNSRNRLSTIYRSVQ